MTEGEAGWNTRELIFNRGEIRNIIQVGQNVYWRASNLKKTEAEVQDRMTEGAQVW